MATSDDIGAEIAGLRQHLYALSGRSSDARMSRALEDAGRLVDAAGRRLALDRDVHTARHISSLGFDVALHVVDEVGQRDPVAGVTAARQLEDSARGRLLPTARAAVRRWGPAAHAAIGERPTARLAQLLGMSARSVQYVCGGAPRRPPGRGNP